MRRPSTISKCSPAGNSIYLMESQMTGVRWREEGIAQPVPSVCGNEYT